VNTVPTYTVVAVVGERLFGLFTRIARMSERPQLKQIRSSTSPKRGYDAGLGGSSDFLSCRCENVRVAASVTTLD